MNITLNGSTMALVLAQHFADVIHGQMVEMHLRATCHLDGVCLHLREHPIRSSNFREVQATIRTITPGYERAAFLRQVKFYLDQRCVTSGTDRKWQDYRASVLEYRRKNQAA